MKHFAVRLSAISEKGQKIRGYERAVLARAASISETHAIIPVDAYNRLRVKYAGRGMPPGPGSCLKRILSWFRIVATHGCSCEKMAKKMNEHGELWCLASGMPEIVATMASGAAERKLWFHPCAGRILVVAAVILSICSRILGIIWRGRGKRHGSTRAAVGPR